MADGEQLRDLDPGQVALDAVYREIEARRGIDFMTHHPDRGTSTIQTPAEVAADVAGLEPSDLRKYFQEKVRALREGREHQVSFPVGLLAEITREEIAALEAEGNVFSGISDEHPHGGVYLKDKAPSSLDNEAVVIKDPTLKAIFATNLLRPVTGIVTVPPSPKIPETLEGLPRIPVSCVVAAVYSDGEWSESVVLPDGNWVVPGFDNTAFQYGEAAFEGGAAMNDGEVMQRQVQTPKGETADLMETVMEAEVDEHGRVTIFRPGKNARRMVKSSEAICLPPVSVDQQVQAVIAAVRNNKKFIPPGGKLYIRSFMVGLRGGTGINPAKQCLFAVEVSPYGDYMAKTKADDTSESAETSAKKLILKGTIHPRGEMGPNKVSSNYVTLMKKRHEAKSAGYADIVLLNEDGFVQECSSNNLFKVSNLGDNTFRVSTPPLTFNQLPGNTRASILEVLRDPEIQERLEYKIEVDDTSAMPEEVLLKPDTHGLFSSGTAAGITNFDGYEIRGPFNEDPPVQYNDQETKEFISALTALLKDLRQGKVPGYEHWAVVVD